MVIRANRHTNCGAIAHELGHLFLQHLDAEHQHDGEANLERIEKEADAKATEWGFGKEIRALNRERLLPADG
jgi:hypothetical protein